MTGEGGALDQRKYEKLDALLNQTDMYTQFLLEQLNEARDTNEVVAETEPENGKAGSKRKTGKAGGKNAKRQKQNATATQVCLMILT